jgi:ADP-ribosylglycohydrolase/fructose-1,6-bisphosphatase/inositol monophosphatase family enzyme
VYERELEFALKAAQSAGHLLREGFQAGFPSDLDEAADQCIYRVLSPAFPDYGYRGEELGILTSPRDPKHHLWLIDPQDGTAAAHKGYRSAAVSVALLRDGLPVLGVVYAYCAPDDAGDLFWWAEGHGPVRRDAKEITRAWPNKATQNCTVLISQEADHQADVNAELVAPMRFRSVVGIAYRLALVAAGEGDVGVSLNSPTGWDVAGGHALLRGAGGVLFDERGRAVKYNRRGSITGGGLRFCFGGSEALSKTLGGRSWGHVFERRTGALAADSLAYLIPGQTVHDAGILSRAQGCLLGQLAGDALGSLVEFQTPQAIARRYPDGPRLLEDGGSWNTIAGQPTDDSELALCLARSILEGHGYQEEAAAHAYALWKDSGPFDIGDTTASALSPASRALREGRSVAEAARKTARTDSQANGALMRISPLGIFGAALEPTELVKLARTDAGLTHPHEICRTTNAVFSAAIAFAIRTGRGARSTYEYALRVARSEKVPTPVLERLEQAEERPPADFMQNQGWVLIAFQNAFHQLLHASTLEAGVIATVRAGGDTDTNAAIAGALLGAVHGREPIPQQWFDRIVTCRPIKGLSAVETPRPAAYWPVDALALAERLLLEGLRVARLKEFPVDATYPKDHVSDASLVVSAPPVWTGSTSPYHT